MDITIYLFYIFSFILLASALIVVSTRNMVHAVMFLILAFFNSAGLFILLGAEFLAMLLIVVYVGAIAVLFLFVVMMLNIDKIVIEKFNPKKPLLVMLAFILFTEIFMMIQLSAGNLLIAKTSYKIPSDISNVKSIGKVLYTDFAIPFELAGAILFIAMIGAIILTLKEENPSVRKQNISEQVARNKANSLVITKPRVGEGIDL